MCLRGTPLGGMLAVATVASVVSPALAQLIQRANTVEPEMIALMRAAHERRGAEDKLFFNLAKAGNLIVALPDYVAGKVPEFDSHWTQAQYQARLGRPLTKNEVETLNEIRILPYRVKSKATRVGQVRSGIAPGTQVFAVLGTLNSGRAIRASLDESALPDIEFGTPPSPP